jgi:hypothetical protein
MANWRPVFLNNYSSLLSNDMGVGTTEMVVMDPLPPLRVNECYYLTIYDKSGFQESNWEVVRVTYVSVSGKDLTVERGVEGMSQKEYQKGDRVEMRLTAGAMNELYCRTRKLKAAQFLDL